MPYMFQYATRHTVLANTGLITKEEALSLFNKNIEDYIQRWKGDEDPEMCIWMDCTNDSSYGDTLHHWIACDFSLNEEGIMCFCTPVPTEVS